MQNKPLRALIAEDREDDALLLIQRLEHHGFQMHWKRVCSSEAFSDALRLQPWDVILSDHSMPGFDAPHALHLLRETSFDIPFIIVSGSIGEEQAVSLLKTGACDYIPKDHLGRLGPAVERELKDAEIRAAQREAELALKNSEQLYRTLVNTSPDAILVCDTNGILQIANPKCLKMLGWDSEQSSGVFPAIDVLGIQQNARHRQIMDTILAQGKIELQELQVRRFDGTAFWVEVSGALMQKESGFADTVLLVMHDITNRKRAEDEIHRQLDRLAALRTIDSAITSSLNLHVTLRVILDELTNQLQVDAADILLLHPHTQTLECTVERGFRETTHRKLRLSLGHGLAGRAALERRLIGLAQYSPELDDPAASASLAGEGFHACIAAPLIAKGQVKGVLEVFHRSPLPTDTEWVSYLETVAEQAAIAIDNSLLFEDLQRTNVDLTLAYDETIEGWSRALDLRDKETEGHTQRVTNMTIRLAGAINLMESELVHVRRGCLLHDIGKMNVPDAILFKKGPLTDEEWTVMRRHPTSAFELLSPIAFLRPAIDIPYCHHEKFDGSGYPRGLRQDQIPLAARLFSVVDVWDALRSDRPYRAAWPEEKVVHYLRSLEGSHFDPAILGDFLDLLSSMQKSESGRS
jgi:PAS domain S-box-containing protein